MSELVLAPFVQVDRQLIARCELGVAALRRVADIVAVVARGQVALAKAGVPCAPNVSLAASAIRFGDTVA